jgi:mRNA-degrading endonuclease RelE of RelBE toxin-antitoxin system
VSDRRVLFSRRFTNEFKRLKKRYRHIDEDIRPLLDQLKDGKTPGDQVPSVEYPAYKVRIPNRDMKSGKSGGYRAIYYLRMKDTVYLVTIYSKRERDNITADEIRELIETVEAETRNE